MKLKRLKNRQSSENIIPLINIVFLLLIFFMISAKITAKDKVEIHPPVSSAKADPDQYLQNILYFSRSGELIYQNKLMNISQFINSPAMSLLAKSNESLVIKADANVSAQKIVRLLDALKKNQVKEIKLLTLSRR